jgi:hypothetical protein
MGKSRPKAPLLVVAGVLGFLALVTVLLGISEDPPPDDVEPVIVCIDSTESTDGVRASYLPDLKAIARRAAIRQARFYAADCGANATGNVDWPVRKTFISSYSDDGLAKEQADRQVEELTKGTKKKEGLKDLVDGSSELKGTPLGEMLAVAARQCGQVGDNCAIYMFTDGEWADKDLKVSDGVSKAERARYLGVYVPRMTSLAGSTVNFVGVGYGTSMGEVHLDEAREIASELVREAESEIGVWTTRL